MWGKCSTPIVPYLANRSLFYFCTIAFNFVDEESSRRDCKCEHSYVVQPPIEWRKLEVGERFAKQVPVPYSDHGSEHPDTEAEYESGKRGGSYDSMGAISESFMSHVVVSLGNQRQIS